MKTAVVSKSLVEHVLTYAYNYDNGKMFLKPILTFGATSFQQQ